MSDVDKLTAPELAERVKTGPVTIMVPDFSDPLGMNKIPRQVSDALSHDVPNGLGGQTVNRWLIYFGGDYAYPMILVTSGDYGYPVVDTSDV